MKIKYLTIVFLYSFVSYHGIFSKVPSSVDSAYKHLKEQFDQYHIVSYVYSDDNAGGNIFIPSNWLGVIEDIRMDHACCLSPKTGRSCTEMKFVSSSSTSFSAIKYVYPEMNWGKAKGYDLSGTTEITFWAKGNGTIEALIGGVNRPPFHSDTFQFEDGIDIRSSGFIKLNDEWKKYSISLSETFWVYLDSTAGLNNKYPVYQFMPDTSKVPYNIQDYLKFFYGADDGEGNNCIKMMWNGCGNIHGGIFFFPPEGNWESTQGYDLTGIKSVRYKAKISKPGRVKFLIGKKGDSCGQLSRNDDSLTTEWKWYSWELPDTNYRGVIGGFGVYLANNLGTPDSSIIYIDSVFYEGVKLKSDFSNVICGFSITADKRLNYPDTVVVYIDEIKYNKDRTNQPRFCQSYVSSCDTIDITMKNRADTYDNALKLIVDLTMFCETKDSNYYFDAKLVGDAFVFAIFNDRKFKDGRLRNSYMCGDLKHWDSASTIRIPGWWDTLHGKWFEDVGAISTSTGNVAWGGIALTSLYQISHDTVYLEVAKVLADWCINNVQTVNGFTGGFTGFDDSLKKETWKSTEHNIDLYALFSRLDSLTNIQDYDDAAKNTSNFVHSMWDSASNHFWTGTNNDGTTINYSNIPLDIHPWYVLAFKDFQSKYMKWVNDSCYLEKFNSPNYQEQLSGYDYNNDKDGIWFEGTAQASLANKLIGNPDLAESALSTIEYVQSNHLYLDFYNNNNKGIVSADHNHVSTGFNWEYHNRLHIGATCWYILAKLGINPFYFSFSDTSYTFEETLHIKDINIYPNPFNKQTNISFYLEHPNNVEISIYNLYGKLIKNLINKYFDFGNHTVTWDGFDNSNSLMLSGIYFCKITTSERNDFKKIVIVR
ncbi:MAG: T9SS type A sorting domain-containing protein [Bacteroidetes bacterium]|nr:MAG: T9SS type A sorting domain-containing protein [Bacteroidota bacterium]